MLNNLYIEWDELDDNRVRYNTRYCLCDKHLEEFLLEESSEIYYHSTRPVESYEVHKKRCEFCEVGE